jgi:hypothetical protein
MHQASQECGRPPMPYGGTIRWNAAMDKTRSNPQGARMAERFPSLRIVILVLMPEAGNRSGIGVASEFSVWSLGCCVQLDTAREESGEEGGFR